MSDRPLWEREGRDWPNREASRFVEASAMRWHVQVMGDGPVLLLLHGTAAATHSWRDLMPLLATRFTVVAPDLPGHGFTTAPPPYRLSLPGMAAAVADLLATMGLTPDVAAGHSAGAAILARMAIDGAIAPRSIVSLNGAIMPLREGQFEVFSGIAKLLVGIPFVPHLFAWHASDASVLRRLMNETGSTLDARGLDLYARLFRRPRHLGAALGMMANWELRPLVRDMPRLASRLVLVAAEQDRSIPPGDADRVRALVPGAEIVRLSALGHLAHEERPDLVAPIVLGEAA